MFMKKVILCSVFLIVSLFFAGIASAARLSEELVKLLESHQVNCWVEGEIMGDLILGARGSIQFIYLDEPMSLAIREDKKLAPWVDDINQYYGSPGTAGKALFVVQIQSNKPWDVEISKFKVGNYNPKIEDVLTPSWRNPIGSLQSGEKGQFAFVVPKSELKKGKEIEIGYDKDILKWSVPK